MDLRDDIPTQLADLSDWLRQIGNLDSPPAPAVWDEIAEGLRDRATFLDAYVLPRTAPSTKHLGLQKFENAPGVLSMVSPPEPANGFPGVNSHHGPNPATDLQEDEDDRSLVREPAS